MSQFNSILDSRIESTKRLLDTAWFESLTKARAQTEIGELSVTFKMPCKSYSLPSRHCLTGSKLQTVPGSICQFCYGMTGRYATPNVDNAMSRRFDIYQLMPNAYWIASFIQALTNESYFRWFDNGDLQGEKMLLDILTIAHFLPLTKFWIPTKERKLVSKYKPLADTFDNVALRYSLAMINQISTPNDINRFGLTSESFTSNVERNRKLNAEIVGHVGIKVQTQLAILFIPDRKRSYCKR